VHQQKQALHSVADAKKQSSGKVALKESGPLRFVNLAVLSKILLQLLFGAPEALCSQPSYYENRTACGLFMAAKQHLRKSKTQRADNPHHFRQNVSAVALPWLRRCRCLFPRSVACLAIANQ